MASVTVFVGSDPESLSKSLSWWQMQGFLVSRIGPADAPTMAEVDGHGLRLRLVTGNVASEPLRVKRACVVNDGEVPCLLRAPEGTELELEAPLEIGLISAPPGAAAAVEVTRSSSGSDCWAAGRAGLLYRDLLPSEHASGRWIASHIKIIEGGPTRDYVHFHAIRFQLIYVRRGWVRLAYEGQPSFVASAGDAVLQPPRIRHKVLASSPGLEVVEVACPASHDTFSDLGARLHEADGDELPVPQANREWGGQRFLWHSAAAAAACVPWRGFSGLSARDLGVVTATHGLAGARVVNVSGPVDVATSPVLHSGEFCLLFVDEGSVDLIAAGITYALAPGDAALVPAHVAHSLTRLSPDLRFLEVTLPGELPLVSADSSLG